MALGDDLLERARQEDARHWETFQRPISAETLRKRLRIGAARSRMLVTMVALFPCGAACVGIVEGVSGTRDTTRRSSGQAQRPSCGTAAAGDRSRGIRAGQPDAHCGSPVGFARGFPQRRARRFANPVLHGARRGPAGTRDLRLGPPGRHRHHRPDPPNAAIRRHHRGGARRPHHP